MNRENKIPAVSIILITYNRSHILPRMIRALQAQTFQDYEVILINNGSTDDTAEVCNAYAAEDERVKLVTIETNHGAAPARNLGLEHISGKYVLMVDDDDYCEPEMLQHLYDMATEYDADIAITGCVDEYSDGRIEPKYVYEELYVWKEEQGLSEFLKREKFHTAPATKLFRKELFEGKRWMEGTCVDDIHFIYKLFVDAKCVVAQGKPMYYFYKHVGNVSGFLSGDILKPHVLQDYLTMQDERVEYISEHCPKLTEQVRYARVSYMISMVERIKKGLAVDCEEELAHMQKYLRAHKEELLNTEWTTERERLLYQEYVEMD